MRKLRNGIAAAAVLAASLCAPVCAQDTLVYNQIQFTLPDDWAGSVLFEADDREVTFYQTDSMRLMGGGGRLFSVVAYTDGAYVNMPSYRLLACDGPTVYTAEFPTDVQCAVDQEDVREEYFRMYEEIDGILEDMQILSPTVSYQADEFVFPNSGQVYLQEEDLYNLSDEQLATARNEIYARRGRVFDTQEWADYFAGCSWYQGTVASNAFTEDMLNDCERANVALILEREAARANGAGF